MDRYTEHVAGPLERLAGAARVEVLGTIAADGRELPWYRVAIEGPPESPTVLLTAGVHGDEVAGVHAAVAIIAELSRTPRGFGLVALPCVNPGGFVAGTLESPGGANLNRLFGTGSNEPEVRLVERALEDAPDTFRFTMDLHEVQPDWAGEGFGPADNPRGCYLYETCADPAARVGPALIGSLPAGTPVCEWPSIYGDASAGGVVSYPEGNGNPVYAAGTTLDGWLFGRRSDHTFTTETPCGLPLGARVAAHRAFFFEAVRCLCG